MRVHDTLDNAVETFVYRDGLNPVAWQRVVGSGTPVRAYFGYGLQAHTPEIMWVDNDGVASTIEASYRIISDERGSVRSVVQIGSGTVVQTITYDPWGQPTIQGAVRFQPFSFIGGIRMNVTGLVHLGARDYDTTVGRWTTRDPIRWDGGVNLYEYAGSDPINYVDVDGRIWVWVGGAIVGGLAGAGFSIGRQMAFGWRGGAIDWAAVGHDAAGGAILGAIGLPVGASELAPAGLALMGEFGGAVLAGIISGVVGLVAGAGYGAVVNAIIAAANGGCDRTAAEFNAWLSGPQSHEPGGMDAGVP